MPIEEVDKKRIAKALKSDKIGTQLGIDLAEILRTEDSAVLDSEVSIFVRGDPNQEIEGLTAHGLAPYTGTVTYEQILDLVVDPTLTWFEKSEQRRPAGAGYIF